ncbi:MAG: hemolysin family protein [Candidatus Zixiibacteriota bacterium]
MILAAYILMAGLIFYIGYVLSLYSSVAYIEPERIEHVAEKLSEFRRKYLSEILDTPRISIQLIIVFKSLALLLLTFLAILVGDYLIDTFNFRVGLTYAIVLVAIWALYLIFIEILPRRKVLRLGDRQIIKYLPLYVGIYIVFKPIVIVFGRVFARDKIDKIPEEQKEDIIERAIETLADQAGVTEPIIEEDEKEMIGQIFQLDVTEVREVMVPRVNIKGIERKTGIDDIRALTRDVGYSRYPVYEETIDNIIGVLYVKDLFTGFTNGTATFDITNYMREPYFVAEKKKISDLLAEFKANKVHIAIVIDEFGGTAGLVTLEDILEEIVGEIQDEHDFESEAIIRLSDNSIRVDPGLAVEKLTEEFDLDYDLGEFETVGGLIYDLVGSVPTAGTMLRWKDILLEVERIEGQRILSVKAWVKKDAGE